MVSTTSIILVLVVLFIAAFTRSALGFGDALIAMPLLAMIVGMQIATPLVALGASTIAITILLGAWRGVELRAAWRLVLATIIGIPFGLYLLRAAPEALVKAILGMVLIGFGLYNLIAPRLPRVANENLAFIFGFVAGILGGAYNANGPPAVIYGVLRGWEPQKFRATLQGYFLPTGMTILISHGLAGLWTPNVLRLYIYALPVIITAVLVGGRVNKKVPAGRFSNIVYACLVIMGFLLIV